MVQAFDPVQYMQLATSQFMPPDLSHHFPRTYQAAMFMRLREHHCLASELPIDWGHGSYDSEADSLDNGWFPPGVNQVEKDVMNCLSLFHCL